MEPEIKILPSEATTEFLNLCQRLHGFIQEQSHRRDLGQPLAALLDQTHDGRLLTRKRLPPGIIILACQKTSAPKITNLQIFFDPPRFRAWRETLGTVSLVFLDPYGIEVSRDPRTGCWHLRLDEKELHMDLEGDEIYEAAGLEIRPSTEAEVDVIRIR